MQEENHVEKRFFNTREKAALYVASGGLCAICGEVLTNFHADHITPYHISKITDVNDGQALCPKCNLKKGGKMVNEIILRKWQEECIKEYFTKNKHNFMAVAWPGSGKTYMALSIFNKLRLYNKAERLVILCNSKLIKEEWKLAGHDMGIPLDPDRKNKCGLETKDYKGMIMTYQQLASGIDKDKTILDLHLLHTKKHKTFVILDEIHHVGDDLSWGKAIQYTFADCNKILLSGTPFRSDEIQITFVDYINNNAQYDYCYSYGEALQDGVCREVYFPFMDGEMSWYENDIINGDNIIMNCGFQEDIPKYKQSRRLITAIQANGDWFETTFSLADNHLDELRKDHSSAAGIIFAMDQYQAKEMAVKIRKLINEDPFLIISDEPGAVRNIKKFSNNNKRWLVAVKMVAEGVNIPRLRIGIFATNTTTRLFFIQSVGRVIRMIPNMSYQPAYFYIPNDDRIIQSAINIKEEVYHYIEYKNKQDKLEEVSGKKTSSFIPISSTGFHEGTIISDECFSKSEMDKTIEIKKSLNLVDPVEKLVKAIRMANQNMYSPTMNNDESINYNRQRPLDELKKEIKVKINKRVGLASHKYNIPFDRINRFLAKYQGDKYINDLTYEELLNRLEIINKWIDEEGIPQWLILAY